MQPSGPILFFDGFCPLCSRAAVFVLRHDRQAVFRFATLQSAFTKEFLLEKQEPVADDTLLLYHNGKICHRSEAVLQIARELGFPWSCFYVMKILPRPLRDRLYRIVAKNRHRWFGRFDQCYMPPGNVSERFLS